MCPLRGALEYGDRTSCVLLVDQFGNLHAPFAQARTFLTEQGFGDTKVVFHAGGGKLVAVEARGELLYARLWVLQSFILRNPMVVTML